MREGEHQSARGEEAVSAIVTINHPGPLWSCPFLRRRCAGRETQGEREIERGGRGGERREKNGGGSAWVFSPCNVGVGGSAAVLLHLLRALPEHGPSGKRLNVPSTGPRTVIGLLQVSGSAWLFKELLHVMNVCCLLSKSAARTDNGW